MGTHSKEYFSPSLPPPLCLSLFSAISYSPDFTFENQSRKRESTQKMRRLCVLGFFSSPLSLMTKVLHATQITRNLLTCFPPDKPGFDVWMHGLLRVNKPRSLFTTVGCFVPPSSSLRVCDGRRVRALTSGGRLHAT